MAKVTIDLEQGDLVMVVRDGGNSVLLDHNGKETTPREIAMNSLAAGVASHLGRTETALLLHTLFTDPGFRNNCVEMMNGATRTKRKAVN